MTYQDIMAMWPNLRVLADDIGESHWVVLKWNQRRRIPPMYWRQLVKHAKKRGISLTISTLLDAEEWRAKAA